MTSTPALGAAAAPAAAVDGAPLTQADPVPARAAAVFPDVTLATDRLVLRPFEAEDAEPLVEMMADDAVQQWTTVPAPYRAADARAWIDGLAAAERDSGRGLALAVAEHLTQRLVGTLRLRATDWRIRATELSLVVAPWARGEGYAGEVVAAVAQWLFEDQRFERLELRTAAGNSAAQQVAQRVGAVSEGVLRAAWIDRGPDAGPGRRSDVIVWSLLPEDFD